MPSNGLNTFMHNLLGPSKFLKPHCSGQDPVGAEKCRPIPRAGCCSVSGFFRI